MGADGEADQRFFGAGVQRKAASSWHSTRAVELLNRSPFAWFERAILNMVAYQGVADIAGKSASATNVRIIIAIMPLVPALLSLVFASETLTVGVSVGGLLPIIGPVVLTSHGDPASLLQSGTRTGDALMLAAKIAHATCVVPPRRRACRCPSGNRSPRRPGLPSCSLCRGIGSRLRRQ
ncbi:hypothetical protein WS82_03675 [Burkholderia sp. MSMB2041]|nr:hypothetical protein WS77_08270 [Burkholderia sp. MSMB0265]KVG96262.1 hypothetical protein WS82_03675 [Burkholderia sp. MSMB2041]